MASGVSLSSGQDVSPWRMWQQKPGAGGRHPPGAAADVLCPLHFSFFPSLSLRRLCCSLLPLCLCLSVHLSLWLALWSSAAFPGHSVLFIVTESAPRAEPPVQALQARGPQEGACAPLQLGRGRVTDQTWFWALCPHTGRLCLASRVSCEGKGTRDKSPSCHQPTERPWPRVTHPGPMKGQPPCRC